MLWNLKTPPQTASRRPPIPESWWGQSLRPRSPQPTRVRTHGLATPIHPLQPLLPKGPRMPRAGHQPREASRPRLHVRVRSFKFSESDSCLLWSLYRAVRTLQKLGSWAGRHTAVRDLGTGKRVPGLYSGPPTGPPDSRRPLGPQSPPGPESLKGQCAPHIRFPTLQTSTGGQRA